METVRSMIDDGGSDRGHLSKEQLKQRCQELEKELIRSETLLEEYRKLYHEHMQRTISDQVQRAASKPSQPQRQPERNDYDQPPVYSQDQEADRAFRQLTLKQHAALQMMVRGASNREIAERFQVAEPTAKVYVRGVFQKFGVRDRSEVILRATPVFKSLSPEEYKYIAGLPKDWDEHWDGNDTVTKTIRRKRGDQ